MSDTHESGENYRERGEVYTDRLSSESGRRTYFFNVKVNRNNDKFMAIVETQQRGYGDFKRHQVIVYEEDIQIFLQHLQQASSSLLEYDASSGGDHRTDSSRDFKEDSQ